MYLFPYFFFGHLIGDYVFQNSYIAAKKGKDLRVLVFHIGLVALSQLLVIMGKGFAKREFLAVLILGVMHFLIDFLKFLCKKSFCQTWYYYLFDQLLHITSLIIAISIVSNPAQLQLFLPRTLAVVLSVSLFDGYFISILTHFITSNGIYKRDHMGYLLRMMGPFFYIFSIYLFVLYSLAWLVVLIYKFSKSSLLNYIFTIISTIMLLEVML